MAENNVNDVFEMFKKSTDMMMSIMNTFTNTQSGIEKSITEMVNKGIGAQDSISRLLREWSQTNFKMTDDINSFLDGFLDKGAELLKSFSDFQYKNELLNVYKLMSEYLKKSASFFKTKPLQ